MYFKLNEMSSNKKEISELINETDKYKTVLCKKKKKKKK
jgi:hypothetical protein